MKTRILLQDDDPGVLEVVAAVLDVAGYECVSVLTPREALQLLMSSLEFDVLICGAVESSEEGLIGRSAVPVIAISGCNESVLQEARLAGAKECLHKPFNPRQLFDAIEDALSTRRVQ